MPPQGRSADPVDTHYRKACPKGTLIGTCLRAGDTRPLSEKASMKIGLSVKCFRFLGASPPAM